MSHSVRFLSLLLVSLFTDQSRCLRTYIDFSYIMSPVYGQMFYALILFLGKCLYGGTSMTLGVDLASIRALVVQIVGFFVFSCFL